jgi:hypothetical protein
MAAASGLTVKEMVLETREVVQGLDEKLDTVIVDYGTRLTAAETKLNLYVDDRKWGITIVVGLVGLWISAMVAVLSGCTRTPPVIVTPIPTPVQTETAIPTATPSLTWTPTLEPTPTATPAPSWSATPTQITQTPAIIEITPPGGERKVTGTYTTLANQRTRACPGIECDVVRTISAGQTLRFYDWRSWLPLEAWICINAVCKEWMASTWDGKEMGEITFDE